VQGQIRCGRYARREIATDRPDITESAIAVPVGSLQFENGFTWTSEHGKQSVDLSESLLRFGIFGRTELRLVLPNYSGGVGARSLGSGFEDLAFGLKQQLGPLPGGVDLSVIVALSFPSGGRDVSSGGYDPFVKFPWSKELEYGWSLGGMQSLFWNTDDGKRSRVWEPTFYVEKQITKPLDAFIEYAADYAQRSESKQVAHFGTALKLNATSQVDFHFGIAPGCRRNPCIPAWPRFHLLMEGSPRRGMCEEWLRRGGAEILDIAAWWRSGVIRTGGGAMRSADKARAPLRRWSVYA
jgi:hypothetical protein